MSLILLRLWRNRRLGHPPGYFIQQLYEDVFSRVFLFTVGLLVSAFSTLFQPVYFLVISYHLYSIGRIDWRFVIKFFSSLSLTVVYCYWTKIGDVFLQFNKDITTFIDKFCLDAGHRSNLPRARHYVMAAYGCLLCCMASILFSWRFEKYNASYSDTWVDTLCLHRCKGASDLLKLAILAMDTLAYSTATLACGCLIPVVYMFHCNTLIFILELTKKKLEEMVLLAETAYSRGQALRYLTRKDLFHYRIFFRSSKRLLVLTNKMYSVVFLLWYGVTLIGSCHMTVQLLNNFQELSPMTLASYICIYTQTFLWIVAISFVSSRVPEKMQECQQSLEELTIFYKKIPFEAFGELNILLQQFNSEPRGVVVGGCFVITKSFFVSYLGVVLTYTVLVIQFNPKVNV